MNSRRRIVNERTGQVVLARAIVRAGFFSRLTGLSLRGPKLIDDGALFVCGSDSRLASAVHTLGLRSSIGVVWLSSDLMVVDKQLAKSWRFAHVPAAPALYYLEAAPSILERVEIGDQLRIDGAVT